MKGLAYLCAAFCFAIAMLFALGALQATKQRRLVDSALLLAANAVVTAAGFSIYRSAKEL